MKIYQKLADINKEVTAIGKNNTNRQQGFKYRGVDDVMNELHSLFAKHEVIVLPEYLGGNREERQAKSGGALISSLYDYKFTFATTDGSTCYTIVRGEGMDSGDKSSNKAIAVALKYALTQMFLIPTDEIKDPDADSPDPKPEVKSFKLTSHGQDLEASLITATTLNELKAVALKIKGDKKLTAEEKDYLRTVYTQSEREIK